MSRSLTVALVGLWIVGCTPAEPPADPVAVPAVTVAAADTSVVADTTQAVFERLMAQAQREGWHTQPIGSIVQRVGLFFQGTPYVGGLLDTDNADEKLIVNLCAFDCVLYVEHALALAQGIAQEDYAFDAFTRRLEALRYRDGQRAGYCSRLHYFSDWIRDNAERGSLDDVTQALGGVRFDQQVDFMSRNRARYPHLLADTTFACIQGVEQDLAGYDLYYIPKNRVRQVYDALQAGDLVATATDIGGLDATHTGFVYKGTDGRTGFLHASSTGAVKIAPDLHTYLQGNARQVGIFVARARDPRAL